MKCLVTMYVYHTACEGTVRAPEHSNEPFSKSANVDRWRTVELHISSTNFLFVDSSPTVAMTSKYLAICKFRTVTVGPDRGWDALGMQHAMIWVQYSESRGQYRNDYAINSVCQNIVKSVPFCILSKPSVIWMRASIFFHDIQESSATTDIQLRSISVF